MAIRKLVPAVKNQLQDSTLKKLFGVGRSTLIMLTHTALDRQDASFHEAWSIMQHLRSSQKEICPPIEGAGHIKIRIYCRLRAGIQHSGFSSQCTISARVSYCFSSPRPCHFILSVQSHFPILRRFIAGGMPEGYASVRRPRARSCGLHRGRSNVVLGCLTSVLAQNRDVC